MKLICETLPIDASDAGPGLRDTWCTDGAQPFLLVDASRFERITGDADIPAFAGDLRCKSLFRDPDLDATAPWLIQLTPGETAAEALRDLYFDKLFGQRVGLLLRTAAPFERLASHLRTFTMVRAEDRPAPLYFRFWDPLVAGVYFPGIAPRPERVTRLLATAEGETVDMLIEADEEHALCITPDGTPPAGQARDMLTLDDADQALLTEVAYKALALALADWFRGAFAEDVGGLPAPKREAAARHVVEIGRAYGFTLKDEFSYLAHLMAHFGGWFFEVGATPHLSNILADRDKPKRHLALQEAFAPAWEATPRAALLGGLDEVRDVVIALPEEARVAPDTLKALGRAHLSACMDGVRAMVDGALPLTRAEGMTAAEEGQHVLLSLMLGHRYHDDPFRPWAGEPLPKARAAAWDAVFG